jgi:hypothetical protein
MRALRSKVEMDRVDSRLLRWGLRLLFGLAALFVLKGSVGCIFDHCGEDVEDIVAQGQMILTVSEGPPREEHQSYFGLIRKPNETDRERFPEERAQFERFKRAKQAIEDPSDSAVRFGIDIGGPFKDPVSGSTTTPGSIRSVRAMPLELVFPLDVGDEIDFRTNVGSFSPEGDNAPTALYAELEIAPDNTIPTLTVFPLVHARGMVTALRPLSIAVQFETVDGRRGEGAVNFEHQSSPNCD